MNVEELNQMKVIRETALIDRIGPIDEYLEEFQEMHPKLMLHEVVQDVRKSMEEMISNFVCMGGVPTDDEIASFIFKVEQIRNSLGFYTRVTPIKTDGLIDAFRLGGEGDIGISLSVERYPVCSDAEHNFSRAFFRGNRLIQVYLFEFTDFDKKSGIGFKKNSVMIRWTDKTGLNDKSFKSPCNMTEIGDLEMYQKGEVWGEPTAIILDLKYPEFFGYVCSMRKKESNSFELRRKLDLDRIGEGYSVRLNECLGSGYTDQNLFEMNNQGGMLFRPLIHYPFVLRIPSIKKAYEGFLEELKSEAISMDSSANRVVALYQSISFTLDLLET